MHGHIALLELLKHIKFLFFFFLVIAGMCMRWEGMEVNGALQSRLPGQVRPSIVFVVAMLKGT